MTCDAAGYEATAGLSMWTKVPTSTVIRDSNPSPVVGVRLVDADRLTEPPAGAVGFLLPIWGEAAGRLLSGEWAIGWRINWSPV